MARKSHEPTERDRQQVTLMAGIGLTHDQIAKVIGVSDETLRKYYSEELEVAASKMTAKVAQNLYSIATNKGAGSVTAAIFWMKARGGWRETERREVTGADGGPIQQVLTHTLDVSELDVEELEALEKALLATMGGTKQ